MKKIIIMTILLLLTIVELRAEPKSIRKKIIIFNLENKSSDKQKTDYLSGILARSLYLQIKKSKKYNVEINNTVENKEIFETTGMRKYKGDFLVTGSFKQEKNNFLVEFDIYVSAIGKVHNVKVSRKRIGAVVNDFLNEISLKVSRELSQYYQKKVHKPVIYPLTREHMFYEKVEMSTKSKDAQIWYTMDGKSPEKDKSILYEKPFSLEETATIKARAFYNNWEPSTEVTRDYIIKYPVNDITMGINYGVVRFIGDSKDSYKDNGGMINVYAYWQVINIPPLRKLPLFRDIAFGADFDAFVLDSKTATGEFTSLSIYAPSAGVFYKFRFFDSFNADLGYFYGKAFGRTYKENVNQFKTFFDPPEIDKKHSESYWKVMVRFNIIYKKVMFHGTYNYHKVESDNSIGFNSYSLGMAYRF